MKVICTACVVMLASQVTANEGEGIVTTGFTYIAGYEPQSEVRNHSKVDLDVKDILAGIGVMKDGKNLGDATGTGWTDNAAAAAELKAIYKSGKNSVKGSGAIRTLAGFSTGAATKSSKNYDDAPDHNPDVDMVKEPFFKVANAYWTTHGPKTANSWADAIITAAFDGAAVGDIDFNTTGADFRVETIGKGIVYLNALPYVFWEMQDAINDCMAGTVKANGDSVHAWDEAVAFYVGSAVGPQEGGPDGLSTSTSGYLMYTLGEKRCPNYKTCTADNDNEPTEGYSAVNSEIMAYFQAGESAIVDSKDVSGCAAVQETKDAIATRSIIPLIQGTLRYLYKTEAKASAKEAGELFAFASAILPYVDQCNSETADALYNKAWLFSADVAYVNLKADLEKTYECLGVSCTDIGELRDDADWIPCVDHKSTAATTTATTTGDVSSGATAAVASIAAAIAAVAAGTF